MNREALKFTDLDAFFEVMEGLGYNGEIKNLIYEQDKLPYCSAYFIPTHLLPANFNIDMIDQFEGKLAQVEEIRYLGIDEFNADFMIFPLSLIGYVEVKSSAPATFVPDTTAIDWTTGDMNFVINLEDGGGKEFYLTANGGLIGLAEKSEEEAHVFKTHKQVSKQLDLLRQKYPKTCQVYALERREFDRRRSVLQTPPPTTE